MKFNDIEKEQWPELKPYLDTCLLPLTGLKGFESPIEATLALEQLRDALEAIEIPFRGRVVTYPALHYLAGVDMEEQLNTVSLQLKYSGFRYVIVLTVYKDAIQWNPANTDLMLVVNMQEWATGEKDIKKQLVEQVQQLWQHEC